MRTKQLRITNLFFKHIKGTHLSEKGVRTQDLARELEKNGFIMIVSETHYEELDKMKDPKYKSLYWKTIDSTRPNSSRGQLPVSLLSWLLGIGCAHFAA